MTPLLTRIILKALLAIIREQRSNITGLLASNGKITGLGIRDRELENAERDLEAQLSYLESLLTI